MARCFQAGSGGVNLTAQVSGTSGLSEVAPPRGFTGIGVVGACTLACHAHGELAVLQGYDIHAMLSATAPRKVASRLRAYIMMPLPVHTPGA